MLAAIGYCDLSATARIIGRKRTLKLIASNAEEERSLNPFIRTDSIFVHVPKAAGVSIARALYGNLGMGHLTLSEYRAMFRPRAFDKMFKFAFVRNPFDRLHSAYHFLRAGGMSAEDAAFNEAVLSRYPAFERFVLEGLSDEEAMGFYHFLPQTHFIDGDLDFVGRFENLARDFAYVRTRVNPLARLPHLNPTAKPDYRIAYTPEMIERAAQHCKCDFAAFGYRLLR